MTPDEEGVRQSMKSLAIRASAGTGKTYELTLQYIARLIEVRDPSKLLATTFTRKAAGEILARIIERLASAAVAEDDAARLEREIAAVSGRPLDWTGPEGWGHVLTLCCRNLQRMNVATLDSLFVRMLAAFLPDLGYSALPAMADEMSAEVVAARIGSLGEALAALPSTTAVTLLRELYSGKAVRAIVGRTEPALGKLFDLAVSTPASAWGTLSGCSQEVSERELNAAIEELMNVANSVGDRQMAQGLRTSARQAANRDWTGILAKGPSSKVAEHVLPDGSLETGEVYYYRKAIPTYALGPLECVVKAAAYHVSSDLAARTRALRTLLDHFARSYVGELRRLEILPFSELTRLLAASDWVCTQEELAYRLGLSVRHVLLDEFQDTNRAQWQVLRRLFLVPRPVLGDVSEPGRTDRAVSVFCVGDTKQAIYGWRGGCAGIFDALDDELPDIEWQHREKSFRSSQIVLDAVNRVFTGIQKWDRLADYPGVLHLWSEQYRPHVAARDKPGYVALIQAPRQTANARDEEDDDTQSAPAGTDDAADKAASRRSAYAAWVAQQVRAIVEAHPTRSVGILVRTNAAADRVAYALQTLGVQASIEGPGDLADDPAVQLILSAMLLADHPGSSAEAFHVLHSPLRGLIGLNDLSLADRARASHRLRRSLAERGLTSVVNELAHALSPFGGPRTARRLTHLLQATSEHEAEGISRPADFVRWVRSQTVHDPSGATVRIMSIHQAKGLQFDIVVAPDLSTKIHAVAPLVVELRDKETDPPHMVLVNPTAIARRACADAERAHHQHREREMTEAMNVLYVLMTRAIHALHMMVPALVLNKDQTPRRLDLSYEAILRSVLAEDPTSDAPVLYQHGDADWDRAASSGPDGDRSARSDLATVRRVVFGRAERRRHWPETSPSELHRAATRSVHELLRLDTQAATQGSLLHAWFQAIEWLDAGLAEDDELLRIASEAVPYADPSWVRSRIPLFREMVQRDPVRSVFTHPEGFRDLWRERSFMIRLHDTVVRGRLDRLVLTSSETEGLRATITDFKTDSVDAEAVPERARMYEAQMRTYALAVSQMLAISLSAIRAQLLFVAPGVVHETQVGR